MDSEGDHNFELSGDPSRDGSSVAIARRSTVQSYSKKLDLYGLEFSVSPRTIKRWIALGREESDLPPLDAIEQMAEWWERMREAGRFTKRVPEVFETCGGKAQEGGANDLGEVGKVAGAAAREAAENVDSEKLGFSFTLQRAREAELLAHARWQIELDREIDEFDSIAEGKRQVAWMKTVTSLSIVESKAEKILGVEFTRWEDVEPIIVKRESGIRDSIRTLLTRVCTKVSITGELFDKLVKTGDEEIDKIFSNLPTGDTVLELEA